MIFKERFINNNGIKIQYLDNEVNTSKTPILICPGLSECANDYITLMSNIKDRRCISLSFRGRGKSDTPKSNYALEDHITDIESIVNHLNINDFCIMGVSRGVSYALGYAIENNLLLKGVIIEEYPPEHKKMPAGWAKEAIKFYNEHCDYISITEEALQCIENDSVQVDFRESLNKITCSTLILKGELEETLLTTNDLIDCVNNLGSSSIRIERFKESGHDILSYEFNNLSRVINEFLQSIDSY